MRPGDLKVYKRQFPACTFERRFVNFMIHNAVLAPLDKHVLVYSKIPRPHEEIPARRLVGILGPYPTVSKENVYRALDDILAAARNSDSDSAVRVATDIMLARAPAVFPTVLSVHGGIGKKVPVSPPPAITGFQIHSIINLRGKACPKGECGICSNVAPLLAHECSVGVTNSLCVTCYANLS